MTLNKMILMSTIKKAQATSPLIPHKKLEKKISVRPRKQEDKI